MGVKERVDRLRTFMQEKGIDACVVVDPLNQYYLTGFYAITYSRPIITVILPDKVELIVPALEELHAAESAKVDCLRVYYEHPEKASSAKSAWELLHDVVKAHNVHCVGVEMDVIPAALANRIASAVPKALEDCGPVIAKMRLVKDSQELELIRNAAVLADTGVLTTIKNSLPGVTELEIDAVGNAEILKAAAQRFPGCRVDLFAMSPSGAERTVLPHVFSIPRRLVKGDVVIHSRQVALDGYRAESERTYFVGEASSEYERLFKVMLEAQTAGINAIRAGVTCREVDQAARRVIQEAGFGEHFIHRTGHGLGLGLHEPPYLRFDNDEVLVEGMVVSVEPAFFVPGKGGFRHSDTVIVTATGAEVVTKAPRKFEELVVG
ncbi:MAG: M24 family metallopeptidase [Bacillota bacterium]